MASTPPPILSAILRTTLQLVERYGYTDAHVPELDDLTVALQRAIAAIAAKEACGRPASLPLPGTASRLREGKTSAASKPPSRTL